MALPKLPTQSEIMHQVQIAFAEDLGGSCDFDNDITANLIPSTQSATAQVITREECVICGIEWAKTAFSLVSSDIKQEWLVEDGDEVLADSPLVKLSGPAKAILTAERTALNFLQSLSGTATTTRYYAKLLANSNTAILDTRKTIPGLRNAQKYAVSCGGGKNHRFGLYDAYLIKENHIASCGSIAHAVNKAKQFHPNKAVEVEVETIDELKLALEANADIVMLDNFTTEQIQRAVALNNGNCKLEVSGNITDERLGELASLGVDYISSGALTKHVQAIDLSLRILN